jgi:hypothetical protein
MTDPTFIPESERQLLAVFDDAQTAGRAKTAVLEAGVPAERVHVGEPLDVISGLRAEMLEELTRSAFQPQAAAIYPKESGRGVVLVGAIGSLVGALVGAGLATIDFGSTFGVRLLVFVLVGITFGATIGIVAGAALGAPRPSVDPAAVRGTTVRVEADDARLRELLAGFHPIRMDELAADGGPIDTVVTEGRDDWVETATDVAANASSDDYSPQPESEAVRQDDTSSQKRGGVIDA